MKLIMIKASQLLDEKGDLRIDEETLVRIRSLCPGGADAAYKLVVIMDNWQNITEEIEDITHALSDAFKEAVANKLSDFLPQREKKSVGETHARLKVSYKEVEPRIEIEDAFLDATAPEQSLKDFFKSLPIGASTSVAASAPPPAAGVPSATVAAGAGSTSAAMVLEEKKKPSAEGVGEGSEEEAEGDAEEAAGSGNAGGGDWDGEGEEDDEGDTSEADEKEEKKDEPLPRKFIIVTHDQLLTSLDEKGTFIHKNIPELVKKLKECKHELVVYLSYEKKRDEKDERSKKERETEQDRKKGLIELRLGALGLPFAFVYCEPERALSDDKANELQTYANIQSSKGVSFKKVEGCVEVFSDQTFVDFASDRLTELQPSREVDGDPDEGLGAGEAEEALSATLDTPGPGVATTPPLTASAAVDPVMASDSERAPLLAVEAPIAAATAQTLIPPPAVVFGGNLQGDGKVVSPSPQPSPASATGLHSGSERRERAFVDMSATTTAVSSTPATVPAPAAPPPPAPISTPAPAPASILVPPLAPVQVPASTPAPTLAAAPPPPSVQPPVEAKAGVGVEAEVEAVTTETAPLLEPQHPSSTATGAASEPGVKISFARRYWAAIAVAVLTVLALFALSALFWPVIVSGIVAVTALTTLSMPLQLIALGAVFLVGVFLVSQLALSARLHAINTASPLPVLKGDPPAPGAGAAKGSSPAVRSAHSSARPLASPASSDSSQSLGKALS